MFRELVSLIPGSQIFAIVTMFLVIIICTGVVIWAVKADRSYLEHMKQLPLEKPNNHGEAKDV